MYKNLSLNYKLGIVNGFLPSFLTLTTLAVILSFGTFAKNITLDFIGVTLRLFQSLGQVTNALNQIINSHVHIEKFYNLDKNKNRNKQTKLYRTQ